MEELKIYLPKKRLNAIIFANALIIISALLRVISHKYGIWSWAIMTSGIIGLGLHPIRRKPKLIINADGIYKTGFYPTFISWNSITGAYSRFFLHLEYIHLVIDRNSFPLKGRLAGLRRFFGFTNEKIEISIFDIEAEKFISFVLAMKDAEKAEKEELVRKALDLGIFITLKTA